MHSFLKPARIALAAAAVFASALLGADNRIKAPVNSARRTTLAGHVRPEAIAQNDDGIVDADLPIEYATLYLALDPSIEGFLAEQQTRGSANYRKWLTPEQFGTRFGTGANDMGTVVAWLKSEGLEVKDVARGRHWITFSGKASNMSRALGTEFHYYRSPSGRHFANAGNPSIPEALAPVVSGFRGLNDFPSQSMVRRAPVQPVDAPNYNNSTGNHFLAPDDLATIFNIQPLYAAGIDGTGQTLVIAGETRLLLTDFTLFQSRFNLPPNPPQLMLFGTDPGIRGGDLTEADLDLEWSTAVARNATIIYAYASNVFTAAQYAVDQNLGQQMSISYGECEPFGSLAYRAVAQQANAEGMTIFLSSGDAAAATCDRSGPVPQATHGAIASWPSTFPEITSVGGTEFDDSSGSFWAPVNNASGGSALSYIPEVAWNDTPITHQLEGGGGAPSVLFTKPFWQQGPGVPADGMRDTPDISLPASPIKYAYLVENTGSLIAVGGTSASSPAWAGIAALLNQYLVKQGVLSQPGLGNLNPALYRLAQSTSDIFHDIVNGDNKVPCKFESPDCVDGMLGFATGPGYDLATGLGSVDVNKFVTEFASGTASATALSASPDTAAVTDTVTLTATVQGGGVTPTGSVDFTASDVVLGSAVLTPSGKGMASASISVTGNMAMAGSGSVTALYSGDGVYTGSVGTAAVNPKISDTTHSFPVVWVSPGAVVKEGLGEWHEIFGITEKNGVATTLTSFIADGTINETNLWQTTAIPAGGTITQPLNSTLSGPVTRTFVFTGQDADGTQWTQTLMVDFVLPAGDGGTSLNPAIRLTASNPVAPANPDPSCVASLLLSVQETGGFMTVLSKLTQNTLDISSQIPVIFGSARLAPYGTLQGRICYPASAAAAGNKSFSLTGTLQDGAIGGTVTANATATVSLTPGGSLTAAPPSLAFSASVTAKDTTPMQSANVTIANAVGVTATIFPANRTTKWLTVAPSSSTGLLVQATAAGLSGGVYTATILATSQGITTTIPVTLTVNGSSSTSILTVANNFSDNQTVAPGTTVYVKGTNLAPSNVAPVIASGFPIHLNVDGVSAYVNNVSAPIYYLSPTQLDVQIPYEVGIGPATLWINNNGAIASFPIQVQSTAPGLFHLPLDALDGHIATTVTLSEFLILFSTGEGDVTPTLITGATPPATNNAANYPTTRQSLSATIGGVPATVLFSGIPHGIFAEMQINIQVDPNTPLGSQPLVLTVGNVSSPPVMVTVVPAQ